MFQKLGIVTKGDEGAVLQALEAIVAVLRARRTDFRIEGLPSTICAAHGYPYADAANVVAARDLIVAVGGDGTLLRAAQLAFPLNVPLLGINLGRLGFLADLALQDIATGLGAILDGAYAAEERFVLRCEVRRGGRLVAQAHALNDVVIQRWNTTRLITLHTYVDGCFVHSQRADGMIVATPTGSTAYALSGGGPILSPSLPAVVLVPICPHTLTNRPIVLPHTSTIELEVADDRTNGDHTRVMCDGNTLPSVKVGDRIRITRHDQVVRLIHPASHDHYAILRAKLQWGQGPC